jgi:uncharacterized protein (TIGR02646 family)
MRRITKGPEPAEVAAWKEQNATTPQNLTYTNMPKTAARAQMLTEQGYLCAYTMLRIDAQNECHIEHIEPQNQSPNRSIDCSNMLACFPGNVPPPGWTPQFPYGAQSKGGSHVNDNNFVSPLHKDVELRFTYTASGAVKGTDATDLAAASTIQMLNLNDSQLSDLRKAAIEERVFADDCHCRRRTPIGLR